MSLIPRVYQTSRREVRIGYPSQGGKNKMSMPMNPSAFKTSRWEAMKAYNRADAIWIYTPQPEKQILPQAMKPLAHPDTFYLQAARGWFELGNLEEARAEVNFIRARQREHPDVMELLWQIAARLQEWERCAELGEKIIRAVPRQVQGYIHKAFALHELGRTQEAWDLLFPMAERFPHDVTIKYNLACYAAQLARLWEAEQWLKLAFTLGKEDELRAQALADPDLKPIWAKIM